MYADDKRFTCEYMLLQGEQRFIFDSPAHWINVMNHPTFIIIFWPTDIAHALCIQTKVQV